MSTDQADNNFRQDDVTTTQTIEESIRGTRKGAQKKKLEYIKNPTQRQHRKVMLLKQLKKLLVNYHVEIGEVAALALVSPPKLNVFGANTLCNSLKKVKREIFANLQMEGTKYVPDVEYTDQFQLPQLVVEDNIPLSLEKMTQGQLRVFIPYMLRCATGRMKPGWGVPSRRPPWWPENVPWANVRIDQRSAAEKQKTPWTLVLRQIIASCYKFFGREDLLNLDDSPQENNILQEFFDDEEQLVDDRAVVKQESTTSDEYFVNQDQTKLFVQQNGEGTAIYYTVL